MAKSLRLLLLDANAVIELHSLGLWSAVVDRCEVLLAGSVVAECKYYEAEGDQVRVDLSEDIAAGRITVVQPDLSIIHTFRARFRPAFLERLDPGEAESLAFMFEVDKKCIISSADKIVWRTLGALGCGESGLSFQEVPAKIGMTKDISPQFSREYREHSTQRGFEEGFRGEALR